MNLIDSKFGAKTYVIALLAALITVIVYLPALQNDFLVNWDDNNYVQSNSNVQYINAESLRWMFTSFHASNWHPLTWLSHAVDYAIWGPNPMGHHLTSVLFHGLNTFLVVMLAAHLTGYNKQDEGEHSYNSTPLIAGAATGLLFGLHPLHVEQVAWISERKDVLCAFFFLLSIISYLKYTSSLRRNIPGKARYVRYGLCMSFSALALLSKPMAVTLPIVLLILDIYPLGRLDPSSIRKGGAKVLIEKLPFAILSLLSSVMTVLAQQELIVAAGTLTLGERILTAFRSIVFYLLKMLWPANLAPLYPYSSEISLLKMEYMGSLAVVAGITAFCIWSWKKYRVFSAAWSYYIVTLLPVLGIVQVGLQSAADRYTYLPGLGPTFLMGLGLARLWERTANRRERLIPLAITSVFVLALLSSLTVKQIKIWKDARTLWNAELRLYPDNPDGLVFLGEAYFASGEFDKAIKCYSRAVERDPLFSSGYYKRGIVHLMMGNHYRAIADFDKAVELNPRNKEAFFYRALSYKSAIKYYSHAIISNPEQIELYINRGSSFAVLGQFDRALEDFSKAISLNTRSAVAYYNRALVYRDSGSNENAVKDFQVAAQLGDRAAQKYLTSKGIGW